MMMAINRDILTLDSLKIQKGSQPLFIDMNSDTYADIVFNYYSNTSGNAIRVALYDDETGAFETVTLGFFDNFGSSKCSKIANQDSLTLSSPNFSSVVDLNSDCVSDIYLTVKDSANVEYGLLLIAVKVSLGITESLKY